MNTDTRPVVPARPRGLIECPHCHCYFLPQRSTAVYCGQICRDRARYRRSSQDHHNDTL